MLIPFHRRNELAEVLASVVFVLKQKIKLFLILYEITLSINLKNKKKVEIKKMATF